MITIKIMANIFLKAYHFSTSFKSVYLFNSTSKPMCYILPLFHFTHQEASHRDWEEARSKPRSPQWQSHEVAWAPWLQGLWLSITTEPGSNIAQVPSQGLWEKDESLTTWTLPGLPCFTLGSTCLFPFCVLRMVDWLPYVRSSFVNMISVLEND